MNQHKLNLDMHIIFVYDMWRTGFFFLFPHIWYFIGVERLVEFVSAIARREVGDSHSTNEPVNWSNNRKQSNHTSSSATCILWLGPDKLSFATINAYTRYTYKSFKQFVHLITIDRSLCKFHAHISEFGTI